MSTRSSSIIALGAAAALSWACGAPEAGTSAADAGDGRPNIVLILADDLGYADIGIYGSEIISTPHIDALAASGVLFTDGYVSHPVCSPSRAGLMTGRYQQRHGWEFNPAGRDVNAGMSLDEATLADRLKVLGYRTGMVGKWHLGHQEPHHPMSRGFDEYFGVLEGGSIFIDSRLPGVEYGSRRGEEGPTERRNKVLRGFEEEKVERYLTDVFTDEAVEFIERSAAGDEPFFLYLSHTTPHTPLQATAEYLEGYRHIEDQRTRVYAAMVASLDESVRRVVETLKAQGVYENTLIAFASDNGCAGYIGNACSNGPLFGFKRYHHEGGVGHPQGAAGVAEEVRHARRVDDVDLRLLPFRERRARRERVLARDLLVVVVGDGGAVVDGPEAVDGARVEQEGRGELRLAGAAVSHQRDITDLVRIVHSHGSGILLRRRFLTVRKRARRSRGFGSRAVCPLPAQTYMLRQSGRPLKGRRSVDRLYS